MAKETVKKTLTKKETQSSSISPEAKIKKTIIKDFQGFSFNNLKTQINEDLIILVTIFFFLGFFISTFIKFILWFSKQKKCSAINIKNKNSTAFIPVHSLNEIIRTFFRDREDIIIKNIFLRKKKSSYLVILDIKLADTCNINETTKEIEEIIFKKLNRQLGTDTIQKIGVRIKDVFRSHRLSSPPENETEEEEKKEVREEVDSGWT